MVGLGEQHGSWGEGARAVVHLDKTNHMLYKAVAIPGENQASVCEIPVMVSEVPVMVSEVSLRGEGGGGRQQPYLHKDLPPPISWALGGRDTSVWPISH